MTPTNRLTHFNIGSNSVLGLPIFLDDAGQEFVIYENKWVHVSDIPHPRLHTVEMTAPQPKKVPQFVVTPVAPPIGAFVETTAEQRAPASKQFIPQA